MGGGFQQNLDVQLTPSFNTYTFSTVNAYLQAKSGANPLGYTNYQASIGALGAGYHSLFWNAFAQDTWQVRPKLLVTYGVRYDRFQPPDAPANQPFPYSRNFRTPGANFAPRLGIAWNIASKTVLRVNSGIFYEAPATNLFFNTLYNNGGSNNFVATILPTAAGAPLFPQVISSIGPGFTADTRHYDADAEL